jgi:hypothetical protein
VGEKGHPEDFRKSLEVIARIEKESLEEVVIGFGSAGVS